MLNKLKSIYYRCQWLKNISIFKYLYFNFLCKQVKRDKGIYVIPYKGAVIQLDKNSTLILQGKNLEIGINKIKGSKAETYVRLKQGAIWNCYNGGGLCYNSSIEVHENAEFDSGYFYMNTRSTLIATRKIVLGDDVWMGRNIIIYDSDFHQMLDKNGDIRNHSKEVFIGDHVWLTNQIMVQKGVSIGKGTVVSPFTVVRKNIPENVLLTNGMEAVIAAENIKWSSERV